MSDELLQIGEVAERVGLSLRTVRYYEEVGLLTPTTRSEGGFRLFEEDQVERLALIKQMKPIGTPLEEMREMLDARDVLLKGVAPEAQLADARERLEEFVEITDQRSRELEAKIGIAKSLAEQIRQQHL